jgi:tetratricopeptide (TPR) repeat protein
MRTPQHMQPDHIRQIIQLVEMGENPGQRHESQVLIKNILHLAKHTFDFGGFYLENRYSPEEYYDLYMTTGRCLEDMGRMNAALCIFEKMHPADGRVLLAKGRCLQKMGRHSDALDAYENIPDKDKKDRVLLTISLCLEEMGFHEEALRRLHSMNQENPLVLMAIGRCLQGMKRYDEALGVFQAMLNKDPENRQVLLANGYCMEEMGGGGYAAALLYFESINPKDTQVLLAIGRCLQIMNRHLDALTVYQSIPEVERAKNVLLATGRCLEEMGHYADALSFFLRVRGDHRDPAVSKGIAHCREELGRAMPASTVQNPSGFFATGSPVVVAVPPPGSVIVVPQEPVTFVQYQYPPLPGQGH